MKSRSVDRRGSAETAGSPAPVGPDPAARCADRDGCRAFGGRALDRLRAVGQLMEKQSRVASWTVRTVTGPMLAFAGFASYGILGLLTSHIGTTWVQGLRYAVVGGLGTVFLYLGLKAVHLTEMANRVWKRSAEYGLILDERRRLAVDRGGAVSGTRPTETVTRTPARAATQR